MPTPTILVHGQTLDAGYWKPLQTSIDRPTVAIDLPGHGSSSDAATVDYAAFGDAVAGAVLASPQNKVALVGHSLGALAVIEGLIALAALEALHRVDRVLLIGLVGEPDEAGAELQRSFADVVAAHGLTDDLVDSLISAWFDADWIASTDARSIVRSLQSTATPGRVEHVCRVLAARPPIAERLPADLPPITVVQLSRDRATPPAAAASVRDALRPAKIIDIDGPHLWPTQDPAAFAALLLQWLS